MIWPGAQRVWFEDVNRFAASTPLLHAPLRLYAQYGVVLFAGFLLLSWWWARDDANPRTVAAALWAPVGMLIAVGLNQPLVHHFHEVRPYTVFPHALVLVARSHDYAFPSDHAVMAGSVAAGVLLAHRRLGTVAVAAALLMAGTRVYVGAHFPLDVAAGLLFGSAVAVLTFLAVRPLLVRIVTGLTQTPFRPFLTTAGASTS
jgi:undecaprenyl-diphosphatase